MRQVTVDIASPRQKKWLEACGCLIFALLLKDNVKGAESLKSSLTTTVVHGIGVHDCYTWVWTTSTQSKRCSPRALALEKSRFACAWMNCIRRAIASGWYQSGSDIRISASLR